jgi:hypothetical protein
MSIRKLALFAAVSALGLLAIASASASASTALRTDPGGGLLTGSTTITNTSASHATLSLPGLGTVNCAETKFDANVTRNSSATSITGSLAQLTFTSCSDNIPVIGIASCTLSPNSPLPVVHIIADNDVGGTTSITDPTVRCDIIASPNAFCYYTPHIANGQGNNVLSTLTFNVTGVTNVPGSGSLGALCGSAAGTFNVTLRHIVQGGTNRTITVTTT